MNLGINSRIFWGACCYMMQYVAALINLSTMYYVNLTISNHLWEGIFTFISTKHSQYNLFCDMAQKLFMWMYDMYSNQRNSRKCIVNTINFYRNWWLFFFVWTLNTRNGCPKIRSSNLEKQVGRHNYVGYFGTLGHKKLHSIECRLASISKDSISQSFSDTVYIIWYPT